MEKKTKGCDALSNKTTPITEAEDTVLRESNGEGKA